MFIDLFETFCMGYLVFLGSLGELGSCDLIGFF